MPRADINGVDLYYEVSGTGPGVVLCHGYTGSHQDWMFQIPVLAKGYQVITMDHRGHGTSEAPPAPGAYSVPIFADDIYQLLSRLGITRCCLAGHSLGGFIALQLALEHPGLLGSLVLIDTASGPVDIPGYAEMRAKLDEISRRDGMEAAFEYNAQHNPMVAKRFDRYPRLREVSRRRMAETSIDGYVFAAQAMAKRADLTSRLGEISTPTLVVVGEEDSPFRLPGEILANNIPNTRLQIVPEAIHCPYEEQPDVFNDILLGFLAEVGSS